MLRQQGRHLGSIKIWHKTGEGKYNEESVGDHKSQITCLQAVSDGRIFAGSVDGMIKVWAKSDTGKWEYTTIGASSAAVQCLQILPDGRIVSGMQDRSIVILG
jgi:WD40 repeat protein